MLGHFLNCRLALAAAERYRPVSLHYCRKYNGRKFAMRVAWQFSVGQEGAWLRVFDESVCSGQKKAATNAAAFFAYHNPYKANLIRPYQI